MRKAVLSAMLFGVAFAATAMGPSMEFECKIVSGSEKLRAGFEAEFCAALVDGLSKAGEAKALAAGTKGMIVELKVTAPNNADVVVSKPGSEPLNLLIGARDSNLQPSAAQGLVLPLLKLINGA